MKITKTKAIELLSQNKSSLLLVKRIRKDAFCNYINLIQGDTITKIIKGLDLKNNDYRQATKATTTQIVFNNGSHLFIDNFSICYYNEQNKVLLLAKSEKIEQDNKTVDGFKIYIYKIL